MTSDIISAPSAPRFPAHCTTIGKRVEYLSLVIMPAQKFEDYVALYEQILDSRIHYLDPVHEIHGKEGVLAMLAKYVPRVYNDQFKFDLIVDGENEAIWRWTIQLKVKRFLFTINGLVHAKAENGKIIYQREYYDPMESAGVIPVFGRLYKRMLQSA